MVCIQIRTDVLTVLVWVHTVCKGYQQMTKVTARKERIKAVKFSKLTFINKATASSKQILPFMEKHILLAEDKYLLNISMWL